MKFFTFYSESHKPLLDLFCKSYFDHCDEDLYIKKIQQKCNGDYHSDGWKNSMKDKLQFILDSLNICADNELMVHCDSDIIFNKGCSEYINSVFKDVDIAFQWDSSGVCMGFFVCKTSSRVKDFFLKMLNNIDNFVDDQYCANFYIKNKEFSDLKFGIFGNEVYTIGMNNVMYSDSMKIKIPKNWKIFHANFTPNLKSKLSLLKMVYNENF